MSASAFKATYSDWKLVRTRQVIQIVFEVPLADADNAYEILGGMPNSSKERWFGIAAIREGIPAKSKRDWREAASDPAECIRLICGVNSRSLIEKDQRSRVIWKQIDDQFQAWKLVEH